jgi:hypothetical protein
MIYYNLLAMIYVVWIVNDTDIQNMYETHWWSALSHVFSQFCLCGVNMLIYVLSAYEWLYQYFCLFCWSLQSCPEHLEVSTKAIYAVAKYSFLYKDISKKKSEVPFCLLQIYTLAENCFMKYLNVVLLTLPKTYRSPLYIKLADIPQ